LDAWRNGDEAGEGDDNDGEEEGLMVESGSALMRRATVKSIKPMSVIPPTSTGVT